MPIKEDSFSSSDSSDSETTTTSEKQAAAAAASSSKGTQKQKAVSSDDDDQDTDVETRMVRLEGKRWETEKHAPLVDWMKKLLPGHWHEAAA